MHAPGPNDRYTALCNSWMNDKVSDLIVSWGQPTSAVRLPDGTTMYEWDQVEGAYMTPDRVDHFSRAQERGAAWCSTRFVTNRRSRRSPRRRRDVASRHGIPVSEPSVPVQVSSSKQIPSSSSGASANTGHAV
jgi:hypothetical protein